LWNEFFLQKLEARVVRVARDHKTLITVGILFQIDEHHFLYLNVSGEPNEFKLEEKSRSILFNRDYTGNFSVAPYEPEFIEIR
jgi:beta-galactosidase